MKLDRLDASVYLGAVRILVDIIRDGRARLVSIARGRSAIEERHESAPIASARASARLHQLFVEGDEIVVAGLLFHNVDEAWRAIDIVLDET